jgi:hypothetical protein
VGVFILPRKNDFLVAFSFRDCNRKSEEEWMVLEVVQAGTNFMSKEAKKMSRTG